MALSSDEIIKREIIDELGTKINDLQLWIFPESSNEDQKPFGEKGGLTFGVEGISYGSCDACWVKSKKWLNPFNNKTINVKPIVALEGTDALNRGSSGNAQYQRFHHALGAVKAGAIGVYYLKKGTYKIQEDLFGMAYFASKVEKGTYLIMDDLSELKELLEKCNNKTELEKFLNKKLDSMYKIFETKFKSVYKNWDNFARKRSTLIKDKYIIKFSGRMKRNFTDGSQRAGHIAVGEMFLTKYFFPKKFFFYLWPKMTKEDVTYLDTHKKNDKEWRLLRNENGVEILTIDDLEGISPEVKKELKQIKDKPLKGDVLRIFTKNMKIIVEGINNNSITVKKKILEKFI